MRVLIRPRLPVLALLLLAPAIPELLTGSTPISTLFFDPLQFAISFLGDIALYGTGALLIREFVVRYHKGWASVLLLGAAYGIAEEGLAVHTFFAPAGVGPVGHLGAYGHAFGVNWLWALGLTAFHATYSIALPILLTQLWFPGAKNARWMDGGATALVAGIYVFVVVVFSLVVGHGPTPALLGLFLGVLAVLVYFAYRVPAGLLSIGPGAARIGPFGLVLAGTLFFDGWILSLILAAGTGGIPAWGAGLLLVALSLGALYVVLGRTGRNDLGWSKYYFATGMLGILFAFDVVVEFSVPGILLVSAVFVYFLYHLRGLLRAREVVQLPSGVAGTTGS